ncbi:adenylate/guanylate cyclase domain-containing protein [Aequorivita echinoideorum]|uniref:Adenylate/guanylate cyclase domain-containing protein n=1 Tax=Aequorivita echinoideorum TaxID=1549647 RepID=A0ABS5S7R6_9FLAO|nr:adenylate/guanylate cyclase domain-containing protein [Aequorivita echinoideorum]MBT0608412.1 adenylate/guanylate cyclase domain-containing protein [Aequorivita echinoideorum]
MAIKPNFERYNSRQIWFYARRAFWILVAWTIISNIMFFYEFITLKSNGVLSSAYDFHSAFTANLIVAISAGIIGGIFTVNLMERWLRRLVFWKALIYLILAYTATALLVGTIGALYLNSEEIGLPYYSWEVLSQVPVFFATWLFIKNYFIWLLIVLITLIVLMVNDKYGPGVFPDYLRGKYFRPKHERRIFMFADIKNATGIAESLGEEKYFNFLKDFFRHIAPAIVQTHAEVYQYVGDEVVVSWKMKWGLKRGNAIQCFYSMKQIIAYKAPKYLKKYGVVPNFKVGYHFGTVMVGEIGQIKRDIAFSGDVLNTTSRIQSMCNELGVEILASKEFADIAYKLPKGVTKKDLGKEKLRGKSEEISLVTYLRND